MRFNEFDLFYQLNRMENIFNQNYRFSILKNAISNSNKKNVDLMTKFLFRINNLFSVLGDVIETANLNDFHQFSFEVYMSYSKRFIGDINEEFAEAYKKDFQSQIYNHWTGITGSQEETRKNFIDVFDDLHKNCILKYPELFVRRLGDLTNLYRAQRGKHFGDYERMIPREEFVRGNNRWNPQGVAYLYLGYDDEIVEYNESITTIEKTCFEELRLKQWEEVSTCKFYPLNKNAKIINFCYEDMAFEDIELVQENLIQQESLRNINQILNSEKMFNKVINSNRQINKEQLWNVVKKESNNLGKGFFKEEAEKYIGRTFMKSIDEAVFKPVDEKQDPELQVYKPFHFLAEYLENKGYSGILFRSTRMNLTGLKGKNLVLFNKYDAHYVQGSMNVYYFDGNNYRVLSEE